MSAVTEHAVLRFFPAGHVAHVLHDACPALPCQVDPDEQSLHEPLPAWPALHDSHAVLPPFTAQPEPDLHEACKAPSCHWPFGHAPHPLNGFPSGAGLGHALPPHECPAGQCG